MKNLTGKMFRKKTNKLYSFNRISDTKLSDTTISGDPTNTVIITIITTSGGTHFGNPQHQGNMRM
jgi:hypothetical protein